MKKIAVSFICIILFTALFSMPSSGSCSSIDNNNIIYVDDDNKDGPWDGTIEYPYQYIQDGVDNASSGYTVFVFNGTYREYVVVNKTINFTGEDRDNTVIDGNVEIKSDWVNITGFTVQNSSWVKVLSNHNTIRENNIINTGQGIWLDYGASYNIITGNNISDNWLWGIKLVGSSNHVMGNVITNNWFAGIDLGFGQDAYNNNISENTIRNNEDGILLWTCSDNSIYGNMIWDNNGKGIWLSGSDNNSICRNNIVRGSIVLSSSSSNVIHGNIITNNGKGISLTWRSMHNTITSNTVSNNSYGIWVTIGSHNTVISGNDLIENTCGIYISASYENRIVFNSFMRNKLSVFFVNCKNNSWDKNYWNRPRLLPKPIFGIKEKHRLRISLWIPQVNFDWHPAREPYDIPWV